MTASSPPWRLLRQVWPASLHCHWHLHQRPGRPTTLLACGNENLACQCWVVGHYVDGDKVGARAEDDGSDVWWVAHHYENNVAVASKIEQGSRELSTLGLRRECFGWCSGEDIEGEAQYHLNWVNRAKNETIGLASPLHNRRIGQVPHRENLNGQGARMLAPADPFHCHS